MRLFIVSLILAALAFAAPAEAQRQWRKSDGPFKGLSCAPDETVVTIVDGVKCQRLPQCQQGEVLTPGPDGLRCQSNAPFTGAPAPTPEPTRTASGQPYLTQEWHFAYAELPMVNGDRRRVNDPSTGRPGVDGICLVWRVGWPTFLQYANFEIKQLTRWYTGWGYRFDLRNGTATIGGLTAPMVQDSAPGRRRVGPDERVTDVKATVPLSPTPPPGCTKKWVEAWVDQNRVHEGVGRDGPLDGMTGTVPTLGLNVQLLRFFAGPPNPVPAPEKRNYDELFFYNAARYVHWEMTLDHRQVSRAVPFTLEEVWRGPGGELARFEHKHTLEPGRTAMQITWSAYFPAHKSVAIDNPIYDMCVDLRNRAFRENRPPIECDAKTSVDVQFWPPGTYEVDIYIDKVYVAAGRFRMDAKDAIYGEVLAKTRNRVDPTNVLAALDARVAGVRFFDQNRKYATRFPRNASSVAWEIDLTHAAPGRWKPVVFEALLFLNQNGQDVLMQRRVLGSALPPALANSKHFDTFSWDNDYFFYRTGATTKTPGAWLPGRYRLDVFVGPDKVASGRFDID